MVARVDYHVVEVCETNASYQCVKHDRNEPSVGKRRIAQAERPLGHLDEAGVCNERRFLNVVWRDWHLIIRHREVER